jgi:hypothetical protein
MSDGFYFFGRSGDLINEWTGLVLIVKGGEKLDMFPIHQTVLKIKISCG